MLPTFYTTKKLSKSNFFCTTSLLFIFPIFALSYLCFLSLLSPYFTFLQWEQRGSYEFSSQHFANDSIIHPVKEGEHEGCTLSAFPSSHIVYPFVWEEEYKHNSIAPGYTSYSFNRKKRPSSFINALMSRSDNFLTFIHFIYVVC